MTETVIAVIKLHRPVSPPVKPGLAADFSRSRIDVPTRGEVGSAMGQSPLPEQRVLYLWGLTDAPSSVRT